MLRGIQKELWSQEQGLLFSDMMLVFSKQAGLLAVIAAAELADPTTSP